MYGRAVAGDWPIARSDTSVDPTRNDKTADAMIDFLDLNTPARKFDEMRK